MTLSDASIEKYQALVTSAPENPLHRFSLGKALFDSGRYDEAEQHFLIALEKRSDWMVVAILLAKCALQKNDKAKAREYCEKALELAITQNHKTPEAEIREMLANLD